MKRYGRLWPQICDRRNIEIAADRALHGKRITKEMRDFMANRKPLLDELERYLINETYQFSPMRSFIVYEPKERVIFHPPFYPDRILHNCVMNVLVPLFVSKFTADTYGSIKGRGITQASRKLKRFLEEHPDWYYLQFDCVKFYPSIDHAIMKQEVRRVIKCLPTLRLVDAIIDAHSPGLAIGVWPSQYLANLFLSPIDHWLKEVARVPFCLRYMDDGLVIVPDKATAHKVLEGLRVEIGKRNLSIKNNVRIAPVECGIDIMGYKFYPTHTMLRKSIKERFKKRVRQLEKQGVDGETFKRKTASYFGWCKHGDCRNLLRTILNDKIILYTKNMEYKRLKEIRDAENWFGLPREKRVSILDLFNVDVVVFDYLIATIRGEDKVVVKFAYTDNIDDLRYFITRSEVMRDKLERDKDIMPGIITITKVKNYFTYV